MTVQPRTLKVTIPAGVIEGQRIRLTGQGTAKATEAVEALLGVKDPSVRVVRAALRCEGEVDPMDLDAIRSARAAAHDAEAALETTPEPAPPPE